RAERETLPRPGLSQARGDGQSGGAAHRAPLSQDRRPRRTAGAGSAGPYQEGPAQRLRAYLSDREPRDAGRAEPRSAGRAAPGADGAGLLLLLLSLLSLRPLCSLLLGLSGVPRRSPLSVRALRAGVAGRPALLHLIRPLSPSRRPR